MAVDVHKRVSAIPGVQHDIVLHSLGWLVLANAIGLLLASLLIWPALGDLLVPFTYGHWITLHLNLQLYGWCSLPLVGLLFRLFLPAQPGSSARWALQLWSGALLFAAWQWLAGHTSSKPFMEWAGAARWVMPAAMLFLAAALASGYRRRWREGRERPAVRAFKLALLLALAIVPFVVAWASSPALYPPINPDSGGATGGSLLGSTLGVVGIILACPLVAGLPLRRGWVLPGAWVILGLHFGWFSLLDHGHRSHHEPAQLLALFSLALWLPLLILYLRRFTWPRVSRPWLAAFCVWGFVLLATALFTFLPGVLDRWKFTNALVAHTHIAMAGMLTSFLVLVLIALDPEQRWHRAFGDATAFLCWHGGCWIHISALLLLGLVEAKGQGVVFYSEPTSQLAYSLRLAGGLLMFIGSWRWWSQCRRAAAFPSSIAQGSVS